jgi:hypothetical protein
MMVIGMLIALSGLLLIRLKYLSLMRMMEPSSLKIKTSSKPSFSL